MGKLEKFIAKCRNSFACILPFDFNEKTVFKLDLSVNNLALINIKELIGKGIGVNFPGISSKKRQRQMLCDLF